MDQPLQENLATSADPDTNVPSQTSKDGEENVKTTPTKLTLTWSVYHMPSTPSTMLTSLMLLVTLMLLTSLIVLTSTLVTVSLLSSASMVLPACQMMPITLMMPPGLFPHAHFHRPPDLTDLSSPWIDWSRLSSCHHCRDLCGDCNCRSLLCSDQMDISVYWRSLTPGQVLPSQQPLHQPFPPGPFLQNQRSYYTAFFGTQPHLVPPWPVALPDAPQPANAPPDIIPAPLPPARPPFPLVENVDVDYIDDRGASSTGSSSDGQLLI